MEKNCLSQVPCTTSIECRRPCTKLCGCSSYYVDEYNNINKYKSILLEHIQTEYKKEYEKPEKNVFDDCKNLEDVSNKISHIFFDLFEKNIDKYFTSLSNQTGDAPHRQTMDEEQSRQNNDYNKIPFEHKKYIERALRELRWKYTYNFFEKFLLEKIQNDFNNIHNNLDRNVEYINFNIDIPPEKQSSHLYGNISIIKDDIVRYDSVSIREKFTLSRLDVISIKSSRTDYKKQLPLFNLIVNKINQDGKGLQTMLSYYFRMNEFIETFYIEHMKLDSSLKNKFDSSQKCAECYREVCKWGCTGGIGASCIICTASIVIAML